VLQNKRRYLIKAEKRKYDAQMELKIWFGENWLKNSSKISLKHNKKGKGLDQNSKRCDKRKHFKIITISIAIWI
jgi:hypothetical protein